MMQLPEEKEVFEVLKKIKTVCPELKFPGKQEIHFYNSNKSAGQAGPHYGIGINLNTVFDQTLNNDSGYGIVKLLIHELIHYNGIMNHGTAFVKENERIRKLYYNNK